LARPKSEDKRRAIIEAAARIFAERGIANAPTSAISKAAGVAEGSLFTYFKTKSDLMNEVYRELRQGFGHAMSDFPYGADAITRLRYIWDKYLDIGLAHPERLKVLAQLRASGKLFHENEKPTFVFVEVIKAARETASAAQLHNADPEFLVLSMRAQAEATIEFIQVHPGQEAVCRELGFRMLLTGLAAK
jgi:AcrR family transcriptional regulator